LTVKGRDITEGGCAMKKWIVSGLAAAFLASAAVAAAQQWQGGPGGGGGMQGRGQRMYDPSKAETVSGEVAAVKEFTSGNGMRKGVGLELKTGGQTILVHLGPRVYIDQQAVRIAAGDKVEVKGVKAVRMGQDVFIAAEVKRGEDVLKLRDENGVPAWAGWRRASQP
jgi:hypothetical protein